VSTDSPRTITVISKSFAAGADLAGLIASGQRRSDEPRLVPFRFEEIKQNEGHIPLKFGERSDGERQRLFDHLRFPGQRSLVVQSCVVRRPSSQLFQVRAELHK